jgi:cell division protein FtsZ
MGNDVRLTLIATGFATKDAFAGVSWDKQMMRLLKGVKSEEELGIPAFLRYRRNFPGQKTQPVNPQLPRML